jgi:hypothetical protein
MSGSMSEERKRSVAAWPKQPRLSSTLHEPDDTRSLQCHANRSGISFEKR